MKPYSHTVVYSHTESDSEKGCRPSVRSAMSGGVVKEEKQDKESEFSFDGLFAPSDEEVGTSGQCRRDHGSAGTMATC